MTRGAAAAQPGAKADQQAANHEQGHRGRDGDRRGAEGQRIKCWQADQSDEEGQPLGDVAPTQHPAQDAADSSDAAIAEKQDGRGSADQQTASKAIYPVRVHLEVPIFRSERSSRRSQEASTPPVQPEI